MKRILVKLFIFIIIFSTFVSCKDKCWDDKETIGYIYKFHEGKDYSDFQPIEILSLIYDTVKIRYETGFSAYPLHNGYYFCGNLKSVIDVDRIAYLSIPVCDINNGSAPEDAFSNYEAYLMNGSFSPYMEFYEIEASSSSYCECYYKEYLYNDKCDMSEYSPFPHGRNIDTNILNEMIDMGTETLSNQFIRLK